MARRALILACGRYADPAIPPLASPVGDGRRLKALLERADVGGYEVRLCEDADTKSAQVELHDFFDQGLPDDLNLLVISGHGLKDRWGRLYFATTDTERERLSATALSAAYVRQQMDDSRAGQKVLVIDACYSGAFIEAMIPKKVGDLAVSQADFGNPEEKGTAIVTASTAVQLAGEKEFDGSVQSVFTRCLIEGIETGRADSTGDGKITLSELFDYVRVRMRSEAPGQTPDVFNLRGGGAVVLARNPAWKPLALPRALVSRANSKDKVKRGSAVEDLEAIAASGAAEAPLALDLLRKLALDDSQIVRGFAEAALIRLGADAALAESGPAAAESPAPLPLISPEPPASAQEHAEAPPPPAELAQAKSAAPAIRDRPTPPRNWRKTVLFGSVMVTAAILMVSLLSPSSRTSPQGSLTVGKNGAEIPIRETQAADHTWLLGDWVIDQSIRGCTAPFTIRQTGLITLAITINGVTKTYPFFVRPEGPIIADKFEFSRSGDRVLVSGITQFELSKCRS